MSETPKRGWLERLGLRASAPDPEDWVVVAEGKLDTESRSSDAEGIVELLTGAGLEARAESYIRDDSALHGITGGETPRAQERVRVAVLVRRRDQARADGLMRDQLSTEPVSDEELSRLAEEAGPSEDAPDGTA